MESRRRYMHPVIATVLLSLALSVLTLASPAHAGSADNDQIFDATNDHRIANSRAPLTRSAGLESVAQAWAEVMAADFAALYEQNSNRNGSINTVFFHNPNLAAEFPDGYQGYSENIAMNYGFGSPVSQLMSQWINSPGHNTNMLRAESTHMGVGVVTDEYGNTWGVQVFGRYTSTSPLDPGTVTAPAQAVVGAPFSLNFEAGASQSGTARLWARGVGGAWFATANTFSVTNGVGTANTTGPPSPLYYRVEFLGSFSNPVLVTPQPPDVTLTGPSSAVPGTSITFNIDVDPNSNGTATVWVRLASGDWFATARTFPVTNGNGSFTTTAATGVQSYRVAYAGATSNAIQVTPVTPTIAMTGPTSAAPGSTISFSIDVDPNSNGTATVWVKLATGDWFATARTFPVTNGNGSFTTTAAAGVQSYRVAYAGATSNAIQVTPVLPSIAMTGPTSAAPGSTISFSIDVDPNSNGTATVWVRLASGDWFATARTFPVTNGNGSFTTTAAAGVQSYRVAYAGATSNAIQVTPVLPTIAMTGPSSAVAGSQITFSIDVDPNSNGTATVWVKLATGDWFATARTFPVTNGNGSFTTTAPAGVQSYRVAFAGATSNAIQVTPVAPTLTLTGPTGGAPGSTLTYSLAVSPSASGTAAVWVRVGSGAWFKTTRTFTVTGGTGSFATVAPGGVQHYRVEFAGTTSNAITFTPN